MGLLYPFPISLEEEDRVEIKDDSLSLKSYGLPLLFWAYFFVGLILIIVMGLTIIPSLSRLSEGPELFDKIIVYATWVLLLLTPLSTLCFFFYEKRITALPSLLKVEDRLFNICFKRRTFPLQSSDQLSIHHILDSPNVAKIKQEKGMRGFQNNGYFRLSLILEDGSSVSLDRHNRKGDLEKMRDLLLSYVLRDSQNKNETHVSSEFK